MSYSGLFAAQSTLTDFTNKFGADTENGEEKAKIIHEVI